MDFKIFCKDESRNLEFLKEYKEILENLKKEKSVLKYNKNQDKTQLNLKTYFYGDSEKPIEKDFDSFRCPSYNKYNPYEENSGVHTFCDKCDGRPSSEYLNHFKSRRRPQTCPKKIIPEHLMGRIVRKQVLSESEESDEATEPKILYKVIIKTKEGKDSGTSAPVCIRLVSKTLKSDPISLFKKCGSLKFSFAPGSKEVFHVKSIILPSLQGVNIKLDAKENIDEWFVDWMSIEELSKEKRKWFFKVDRWLSSWRNKCELIAKLKPETNLICDIAYIIKLWTSNDSVDEFTGQLTVQLVGSERKSDVIMLVNNKKKLIKKGSIETYEIKSKEVDLIKALRIAVEEPVQPSMSQQNLNQKIDGKWKDDKLNEFNRIQKKNSQSRPLTSSEDKGKGWKDIKIDKISIQWKGSDKKDHLIEFLMNDWIGLSHKMKKRSIILKEPLDIKTNFKDISKLSKSQEESTYDVTFYTGKQAFSGTDATVYVKFYGSYGLWSKTYEFEDYNKKRFESKMEDTFRIKGPNVGSIEKVNVSHSGSGFASGWKLEKMIIIRHLTATEICNVLEDLKNKSTLPKEISIKDGEVILDRKSNLRSNTKENAKKKNKSESSSSASDYSDDDKTKPLGKTLIDKTLPDEAILTQLPYAEEARCVCKKWLSGKEGEKSLQQTLDVDNKKFLFSPITLLLNMEK